jgi:long-chain acyl-CoA synthetase
MITLGDMGYLDADGYLSSGTGRRDGDLGEVNIYPGEIEHALLRVPGVLDCAVVGLPDPSTASGSTRAGSPTVRSSSPRRCGPSSAACGGLQGSALVLDHEALPRDDNGNVAKLHVRAELLTGPH